MDIQTLGFQRKIHYRKDWSFHRTFGEASPLSSSLATPRDYTTRILNQGNVPACTAFVAVAIREWMKGKKYDPLLQWQNELKFVGDMNAQGIDLDSQMAVGVKTGFVPEGQTEPTDKASAYYSVTPTKNWLFTDGLDRFDAIRSALEIGPLSAGLIWYDNWTYAKDGIIPHLFLKLDGDHDVKIAVKTTIDGVDYIGVQGSWGPNVGKDGIHYFDRYMANKVFTLGIRYWTDDPDPQVQRLGLINALYQNVLDLLQRLVVRLQARNVV